MAEATNGTGNGQALQRAAEGALFQAAGRWLVPAVCGLILTMATITGYLGIGLLTRLLTQQDDMAKGLSSMQTDVAVMKNDIGYLKQKVRP